jgi:hypothetical protein
MKYEEGRRGKRLRRALNGRLGIRGGTSGPTLNFEKSQDPVTKNPKIKQKFPSYRKYKKTVKMRTLHIHSIFTNMEKTILLGVM